MKPFSNSIFLYIFSKLTEINLIDDFINLLRAFPNEFVAEQSISFTSINKTGKKFIASLEILMKLIDKKNIKIERFMEKFNCKGYSENKIYQEFKKQYNLIEQNNRSISRTHSNTPLNNNSINRTHSSTVMSTI